MIRKNVKFGKNKVDLMEFGRGDIFVQASLDKSGDAYVMFKNSDTTHPIGEIQDDFINEPELVMVFDDVKSIDVVIEKLTNARIFLESLEASEYAKS